MSDTKQQEGSGRLHFLDSLRGLAALYVVAFHLLIVPQTNLVIPSASLRLLVEFGGTGVFLFFVISGFSLSLTMPRHDRTPWPAASYGVSRIFRIAPLFYAMLILTVIQDDTIFGARDGLRNILLNSSLLFNLVPHYQEGIVWASWTIGVEMLFYAVFLPIYRTSPIIQIGIGLASLGVFAVADSLLPAHYTFWSVLGWVQIFIIGMLAFELYDLLKDHQYARTIGLLAIIGGVAALGLCAIQTLADKNIALRIPIGLGYAALLIGCGLRQLPFLSSRPLRFYGRISYSVYLVHPPIIVHCSRLYYFVAQALPSALSYWICLAATLVVVPSIAFLAYRFVELPGIRLGKHMLDSLWRQSALVAYFSDPSSSPH